NQLRVRVLQRGSGRFSVILEEQNVFEAPVFLEVENTIAEGPQNVFDSLRRKRRQGGVVVGRFDDDFVGADAIHLVKHAFGLFIQIALDSEGRELVRNNADRPTRTVFQRSIAVGAWAVRQDL